MGHTVKRRSTVRPFLSKAALLARPPFHVSAAIVAGLSSLALSACASLSPAGVLPQESQPSTRLHPATGSTPYPFVYQTVDDPASNDNEVTGINQLKKIVGVFGGGESSGIYRSYSSQPPFTKFRGSNDPGAQGTFATALSSNKIVAGYVMDPNSLGGIWAFAKIKGLWALFADPNEGDGSNAVTEILGINDSENAVGFYTNSSGVNHAFILSLAQGDFTDL